MMLIGLENRNRKSTFSGCFFLGNNLVSWFNRKKNCITLSTVEAKYIAASSGCSHAHNSFG